MTAVTRFPLLALDDLDDDQRDAAEPILAFIGGITGPFNATLRSPEITRRSFKLGEHLLFETTLPRRLVEMAVLIRARASSSQFEWYAHHRPALEAGLADEICEAIRLGRRPAEMADDEEAVFDFCTELATASAVGDAAFDHAKETFGERGVVELAYVIAFYAMVALVLNVAEVDTPDGTTPLPPFDGSFG